MHNSTKPPPSNSINTLTLVMVIQENKPPSTSGHPTMALVATEIRSNLQTVQGGCPRSNKTVLDSIFAKKKLLKYFKYQ